MNATTAISVRGLRKAYGDKVVLDGIDLEVRRGSVFALLGPNGAGKTTVVNILSTLIAPDAGTITIAGCELADDPDGIRRAIGVTGQFSAIDSLLNGEENLLLMADLHHLPRKIGRTRTTELLAAFDLTQAAKQLPTTYSGGMQRKLDLAMTLMGEPDVIFLDEPTTGLDPRSRRTMWDIIRDLVANGVTIFLTTQYLDEADQLADRIALLDHGHIIAEGRPDELKRQVPGGQVKLRFPDNAALQEAAGHLEAFTANADAMTLVTPTDGSVASLRALLDRMDGIPVDSIAMDEPGLDDVFFSLTGRQAESKTETEPETQPETEPVQ